MTSGLGFAGGLVVGQLVTKLVADASDYMRAMDDSEKRAQQWRLAVGGALSALGASAAAYIGKATLTAARTEVLGTSLETVAKSAGYTKAEIQKYEESVKRMGITTQEARLSLVRFIQSNLDLADAAKLARAAQDLAVISGQNSSEAFATITQAIAAQRPILLRQYGIVKDLADIYRDFGRQLGIYTETVTSAGEVQGHWTRELTQTEKKQAFLNVVLQEAAKVSGVYASAMDDAGKKLTSLPRVFQEAQNAIGEQFLPAFNMAVTAVYEGFKWFDRQSDAVKKTAATALALAAAIGTLGGAALIAGPAIMTMGSAIAAVSAPVAAVSAGILALSAAWNFNFLGMRDHVKTLASEARVFAEYVSREFGPVVSRAAREWARTFRWAASHVSGALGRLGVDTDVFGKIWDGFITGMKRGLYEMVAMAQRTVTGFAGALSAMAKAARGDFKGALDEAKRTMREMAETTAETAQETVANIRRDIQAIDDLSRQDEKLGQLARAWEDLGNASDEAAGTMEAASVDVAAVWERIAEQIKGTMDENQKTVLDTFNRIADEYAQHAVNIVDLEYQRTDALTQLEREYNDLRVKLQERGDERGLQELEKANKRKRAAIIRYYNLRINDEKRKQDALLTMAKTYLTIAKANLKAAMAEQVTATKISMDSILSITRHAWGGVTTISRAAQAAMKGAWDTVDLQKMMDEIDAAFAGIEQQAREAADAAAAEFEAWRDANESLSNSLEDVGVELGGTKRKAEKLRDPLEEAAQTTERIGRMVDYVRNALEELAAFGGPRGDWLTPLREIMDDAIVMVDEWAERVDDLVKRRGDILVGDGRKTFTGILSTIQGAASALGSVIGTLDKLDTFDVSVSVETLSGVVEWGRAFIDGMASLEDLADTATDKRVLGIIGGLKSAGGGIAAVVDAVGKLGALNVSEGDVLAAFDMVKRLARDIATGMMDLEDQIGLISSRTKTFSDRLKALVAPISAISDVMTKLGGVSYMRNRDVGALVGWAIDVMAQVAVRMEELRRRLPERYIPGRVLLRFADSISGITKPIVSVSEALSALSGVRATYGTGAGELIGWAVEVMAQVAVRMEELRWRLPERYIPNTTLTQFAKNMSAIMEPVRTVGELSDAIGRMRSAGRGVGDVVGWAVEVMAQVAVRMGELRRRLPAAYIPDEAMDNFAASVRSIMDAFSGVSGVFEAVRSARMAQGSGVGETVGFIVETMAQVAVRVDQMRRRLPANLRNIPPQMTALTGAIGEIVKSLTDVIGFIDKLGTVRTMRGENVGGMVGWVVEVVKQVAVRSRALGKYNTGDMAQVAATLNTLAPALEGLRSTAELLESLGRVAPMRGRMNAGRLVQWLVDVVKQVGERVRRIPARVRTDIAKFSETAADVSAVMTALSDTAGMMAQAAGLRNMEQAKQNVMDMVDVWGNILTTLSARIASGEITVNPVVQKWGEAVSALVGGLSAGVGMLREARLVEDVRALIPIATDIGTALVEFSNALAVEIRKYDATNDETVSTWGAAVGNLMSGLTAGVETLRNLPKTWSEPGAVWDAFKAWVKATFKDFEGWVTAGEQGFDEDGLNLVATFSASLSSLMGGLRSGLELAANLPATWDVPRETWTAFKGWVKDTFQEFDTWARGISTDPKSFEPVQAFGSAMQSVFSGLGEALDVFKGLIGYIPPTQANIDAFTGGVKSVFSDMKAEAERLGDDGIDITKSFGDALQSLMAGLSASLDLFTSLMNQDVLDFIGTGDQKDGRLAKALSDLVQGISVTMSAFQTWVINKYSTTWGPAADMFRQKVDAVIGTMRAALDLFTDLEQHGLPSTSLIQQFIDQTINLFKSFAAEIGGTDDTIESERAGILAELKTTTDEITNMRPDFVAAATALGDALGGELVTAANMEWRGAAMMLGLKTGLENKRGDVVAAMRTTAEAMRKELERAWGIASPSRVAMSIGEQINAGLIAGLGDSTAVLSGGKLDVNARKEIYVRVNVTGQNMTPEQRWELARELSYLVRAGA